MFSNTDEAVQKIEKKVTFARLMNKFQSEMSSTSSEVDGQSKRTLKRPCPNQGSDSLSSLDYTLGIQRERFDHFFALTPVSKLILAQLQYALKYYTNYRVFHIDMTILHVYCFGKVVNTL